MQDYDIVCLSETKNDNIERGAIENLVSICMPKRNNLHRYGGIYGICVLVKEQLAPFVKVLNDCASECVLWMKIDKLVYGTEVIIGATYIPHEGSPYYDESVFDTLLNDIVDLNAVHDCPISLVGDFNSRTGELTDFITMDNSIAEQTGVDFGENDIFNSYQFLRDVGQPTERVNLDKTVNSNGKKLIEFCKATDLKLVNSRYGDDRGIGEFTCYNNGKSAIDYAIVSPVLMPNISGFAIDTFCKCLSDTHCPISISFSFGSGLGDSELAGQKGDTIDQTISISRWNPELDQQYRDAFNREEMVSLNRALDNVDMNGLSQDDVDEFTSKLCNLYLDPAKCLGIYTERNVKFGAKKKTYHQPWFDKECDRKRSEYIRFKGKLKRRKTYEDIEQLKIKAKQYKKFLRKVKTAYKKDFHKTLRNLRSSNPKEYWSLLNKGCKKSNNLGKISIEVFMHHFKKLSQKSEDDESDQHDFDPRSVRHSINEEINGEFTVDEIVKLIRKLRNKKACGVDHVINEYIKHCPVELLGTVVKLFNIVLKTGIVPSNWCIGLIKPLYKNKGSPDDPDNYRGITLLSCLGKLFTSCLNDRLSNYIEGAGIMGEEQAGFRAGYCTLDHIFVLHSIIDLYVFKKKRLYCAFIDYRKAFDLVDRCSLWQKLINTGINGKIITVIYNLYNNAKSSVKLDNNLSESFSCNIGVRQGENLSPLLFAIYLNDFEYSISKNYKGLDLLATDVSSYLSDDDVEVFLRLYALLYADDTIVMAETPKDLQVALDSVHMYCNDWKLHVNTSKTKIVIFSKGKVRKYPDFKFGTDILEVVDDYTYLGTTFNYNGRFKKAIDKQVSQATRAMFSLGTKARKLLLPIDVQLELFDLMIVPILLYGCEVWGFQSLDKIEVFYRKYLRNLLKVNKSTPNCMTYGEVGKSKLQVKVDIRMIQFWAKIINGKDSKLSKILYNMLKSMHDRNIYRSKWIVKVKSIVDDNGFSFLWDEPVVNAKWLKEAVAQKLKDINQQQWQTELDNNRFCTNYKIVKDRFIVEPYLLKLDFIDRINLSRFRCGSHRLPISINKYSDQPVLRLCNLCNLGQQGDEFHYTLVCPRFDNDRKNYVKRYYYSRPNNAKFNMLFNTTNYREILKLAKFVRIIMSYF